MDDKGIIGGVVVLLLVVGGIMFAVSGGGTSGAPSSKNAPAGALELAQCLKDSGATFYGAFWCPHCKTQKEDFGSAAKALPYVECSTADGKGQNAVCAAKKIDSYPTWEFKDGTRITGEQTFATLAEKSGCTDPTATPQSGTSTPDVGGAAGQTLPVGETPNPTLPLPVQ